MYLIVYFIPFHKSAIRITLILLYISQKLLERITIDNKSFNRETGFKSVTNIGFKMSSRAKFKQFNEQPLLFNRKTSM